MADNIDLSIIHNADATPADEIKKVLRGVLANAGNRYTVTITSAQLLALNATPITVLPAPGAGKAYVVERVEAYKAAGTAYAGIDAAEDIAIKYTNASGAVCATIETTGFLDQATAQTRTVAGVQTAMTPVANAVLVAHMLNGEITTGTSPLKLRITARIIDMVF